MAVSLELLQDSNWPFGTVLERVFAMRFARGIGAKLITGNGVNTLTGLLTGVRRCGRTDRRRQRLRCKYGRGRDGQHQHRVTGHQHRVSQVESGISFGRGLGNE